MEDRTGEAKRVATLLEIHTRSDGQRLCSDERASQRRPFVRMLPFFEAASFTSPLTFAPRFFPKRLRASPTHVECQPGASTTSTKPVS